MAINVVLFLLVLFFLLAALGCFIHSLENRRPWAVRLAVAMALANAGTASRHLHDPDYLRYLLREFDRPSGKLSENPRELGLGGEALDSWAESPPPSRVIEF
ncbi:MAG: hypothetical protein AAGE43_11360 [Pseudomonadota bacterium]